MTRILINLGVAMLQLIMTQVVTFLASMLFPGMDNFPQTRPILFAVILSVTFTTGVFVTGWLALEWRWLRIEPKLTVRLIDTLLGACLPLSAALVIYPTLEPGNPFFTVSIFACILGFYIPGLFGKK